MASASKQSRSPEPESTSANGATSASGAAKGKKGPTPTRREREQQNLRPLVPADRKAAQREAREKARAQQAEVREGMARGDDRYLPERDRGPQKRFMRDRVDARLSLGELLIPIMFLVIFTNFLPDTTFMLAAMAFVWIWLAASLIDGWIAGRGTRRRIAEVVGEDRVEKGIIWGTIMRALQLRFLRMPKAQAPRFSKPEFTGR